MKRGGWDLDNVVAVTRREATLIRAASGGIKRSDLYRRVRDRMTADELNEAMRVLWVRGLITTEEGPAPRHGRPALFYQATGVAIVASEAVAPPRPAKPAPLIESIFVSVLLQEVVGRLAGAGHRYRDTRPGRVDAEVWKAAGTLTAHWTQHPGEPIAVAALGRLMLAEHGSDNPAEVAIIGGQPQRVHLALALSYMVRRKLLKLTTKGAVIVPGEEWAENER